MRLDPLVLGLRTAVAWSLRSALERLAVSVGCVVVTRRNGDDGQSLLTACIASRDADANGGDLEDWPELAGRAGAGQLAGDGPALIRLLAQHPAFAGHAVRAVTAVRRPPLSAFLALGGRHDSAADASVPVLVDFSRQLEAALTNYSMCKAAAATGHELTFLGMSEPFLRLDEHVRRVASHPDAPVLISGERGAGKEAVAYAIHYHSARRQRPFVVVNSAALHPDLFAAELFGCRRGAYTGANEDRRGRFEAAEGGTLFFDEITEMPPHLYAVLLRAFDRGEIQKLGETRTIRTDVRLIAATNRNLEALVREGRFPADLYDRICALRVTVPPLRDRKDDVAMLASYFLRRCCDTRGDCPLLPACEACARSSRAPCMHPDALAMLRDHPWPGNVRELKNVIVRLRASSTDGRIGPDALPPSLRRDLAPAAEDASDATLAGVIRTHITRTLQGTGWNKSAAARALDIPLSTLVSKMERFGIPQHPS